MAVTVDATVGGANANSFVTLVTADAFMESRLNASTWGAATTDNQNRALVEATRYLSALNWIGRRVDSVQALAWPRESATNPDSPTAQFYDQDEIPDRMERATSELAFQYIKAGTLDVSGLDPNRNIKRKKVDVLETEFVDSFAKVDNLSLYPSVTREISPLLIAANSLNMPTVRG